MTTDTPPRPALGWIVAAIALTAAYVAHAAWHGPYIEDDAGITFGYAWHIAAGNGPTINPGEAPVEGYSNPAWTFLLALLVGVGAFHPVYTPKLLGGLFALGAGLASVDVARRLSGKPLSPVHLLAPALLAVNGSFVVWSIAGLENASYAASVLALLALRLRERDVGGPPLSALAAVLVALGRPEGLGYALLAGADVAAQHLPARRWKELGAWVAAFALPFALYVGWHAATFQDPLPNTFYAKVEESDLGPIARLTTWDQPGWVYLRRNLLDWHAGWAILAGLGAWAAGDRLRRGVPLAAAMLAFGGFFVLQVGGDWMMEGRFLTPSWVLLASLAAAGLAALPRPAGLAVAGLGLLWSAAAVPAGLDRMARDATMPMATTMRLAESLLAVGRRLGLEKPVVLQGAMGGPSWVAKGRLVLVDAFGLTDRTIAQCLHRGCPPEELWAYAFDERKVHFANLPPTMAKVWDIEASPQLRRDYVQLLEKGRGGSWIRRDLFFAPWDETYVTAPMTLQGDVRVHRAEVLSSTDTDATVGVWFSLRPGWTPAPLEIRATLGDKKARIRLFDVFDPALLTTDAVYLDRVVVPIEPGQAQTLALEGVVGPSDLPPSAKDAPTRDPNAAPLRPSLGGWSVPLAELQCTPEGGAHARCTPEETEKGAGLRIAFEKGQPAALACTAPLLVRGRARMAGWVKVEEVTPGEKPFQTFTADIRWFGPDGKRLPTPGQAKRYKDAGDWTVATLEGDPPKGADRLRFCWTFLDSRGVALVADAEIAGAEPAPETAAAAPARPGRPAPAPELRAPPALGGRKVEVAGVQCFPPKAAHASCSATSSEKGPAMRLAFERGDPAALACTAPFPVAGTAKAAGWVRLERLEAGEKPFQTFGADVRFFGADKKRIPGPSQPARFREVGPWKVVSLSAAPPAGAATAKFCWTFQDSAGVAIVTDFEAAGIGP